MVVRAGTYRRHAAAALAMALGFAWLASFVWAIPAHAGWESDLQRQLKEEYNCEIAYLSRMEVRKVDGREIVFVRAHCNDKRSFDATRQSEAERFAIKACDVQAC